MQLSTLSGAVVVAGVFSGLLQASGQIVSDIQCMSSWSWSDNSLGQNPCLVAAYLEGVCNGGNFEIDSLPSNRHYVGPTLDLANECQCSTAVYSLVGACGACQNSTYLSWSAWSFNCTGFANAGYPYDIPTGTAVPNWAYLDVVTSNTFNPTLAETDGDTPEATPSAASSTVASSTSTSSEVFGFSSSAAGSSPTSGSGSSSGSSHKKTNVGAIAGGVVGGVVALAALALLLVFLLRRNHNKQKAPSQMYDASKGAPKPPMSPNTGYDYESFTGKSPMDASFGGEATHPPVSPALHASPPMSQMPAPKLYDPSDPTTFPSSMPEPTVSSAAPIGYPVSSLGYHPSSGHGSSAPSGHYSGVPEV